MDVLQGKYYGYNLMCVSVQMFVVRQIDSFFAGYYLSAVVVMVSKHYQLDTEIMCRTPREMERKKKKNLEVKSYCHHFLEYELHGNSSH